MLYAKHMGSAPELSAAVFQMLALCANLSSPRSGLGDGLEKIRRAERQLSEHMSQESPDLKKLASDLGWGYSYFRRVFKEQTGLSPWQYHLQARLSHVRRLLASSNETMENIAEISGFSSAFHLSNSFKKAFGISPVAWRKKFAGKSNPHATMRPKKVLKSS